MFFSYIDETDSALRQIRTGGGNFAIELEITFHKSKNQSSPVITNDFRLVGALFSLQTI